MLDHITPVLLTFNEAPNIARTMSRLLWARDIVVVDSGSTDETLAILATYSHVRLFHRPFESHGDQWRYATRETSITTDWILRLDADYWLTDALIEELAALVPDAPTSAYKADFDYAIFGRKLVSSFYPANSVLLRQGRFSIVNDGHTERWIIDGTTRSLKARIIHDDRKAVSHWLQAQTRYMQQELTMHRGGMTGWLRRRPPLMPIAAFLYCLFGKGLIFSGRAGIFYALQRLVAEAILALLTLERKLGAQSDPAPPSQTSNPE
jgi:glycosyltransferase involved in cell wall biosynthesis